MGKPIDEGNDLFAGRDFEGAPRQKSFWTSMMSRQSVGAAVMRGVFQRVDIPFC